MSGAKNDTKTNVRVGVFVLVALIVGSAIAFVLGSRKGMFSSKTDYVAVFEDVGGLVPGNTVRIAGVTVGSVQSVEFEDVGTVRVRFSVLDSATDLIRGNPSVSPDSLTGDAPRPSVVIVGSKGMLGDRLLDISVGARELPEWPAETPLFVNADSDLMARAGEIAGEVEGLTSNLRRMTEPFANQELANDLNEVVHNLAQVTGMLASGDGAVQRLMTDPQTGDELVATLQNLRSTSAEFSRTARSFRQIADEVRSGDGSAHALIYGNEAEAALDNIGEATGELAQILSDVREGDGTVHDLIYEDTADELLANLTQVSEDAAAISADVRAGRGTIGGFLVDPSIYEDVKRLVGDLERNDILRALVRYSIRRDEAAEAPEVEE